MCGICGGTDITEEALARMSRALRHRGPDDDGAFTGERVRLGARRLAVIDPAGGHQPVHNENGTVTLVCNGEIYNHGALRDELIRRGHRFATRSDTEAVVHAYEEWGSACVRFLRGMFAFAVYDRRDPGAPLLFLARDRLGIKPLYYADVGTRFLFASEVRALLASGLIPARLDPAALWAYLGYQTVATPHTLVAGVRSLPPGHALTVDCRGGIQELCYWDLLEWMEPAGAPCRERVRNLLEESVGLHLVSDVPVGIFLSGGIDSSSIVALVRAAGQVPTTFTVGFSEAAASLDERHYARSVADRFGAEHTELVLNEDDLLDQVPDALGAFDHPSGDGVNTYLLAGAVRRAGFKVALSGLGGDEFFGGYSSFRRLERATRWLGVWRGAPAAVRTAVARLARRVAGRSGRRAKAATWLASDGSLAELYPVTRQLFLPDQRAELLSEPWRSRLSGLPDPYVDLLRKAYARTPGASLFSRIAFAEARTYMHDVLLRDTDQMSMAHGLEVRVPLLDHRLVQYLMTSPDAVNRHDGRPKRLLIESLADLLPAEIVGRRKRGFTLPFEMWLRGPLGGYAGERLGPERLGARGVFRADALTRLWSRFRSGGRGVTWSRVWTLVALEEWLEANGVTAE